MGLRAFICVVVAFLTVQGSLADWESNEKSLKWIFDVKNAVTTQNQTFKQNTKSGAFRYHYDVSAQNTYKYEVQSGDSVTMGCYGWKDAAERWHSTNYVADSHGWRTLRDINQPVDVYPVFEEHTTRTFLDNVPQCLSFTIDSAPRPSFVFTNHPPTPPPVPFKLQDDHVPHGSEQIHRIVETPGVLPVSTLTTARPSSFRVTPPVGRPSFEQVGFTSTTTGSHPSESGEFPSTEFILESRLGRPISSTHQQAEFEKQRPAPLGRPPSPAVSGDELINQPTSRPNVIRVPTAGFPKPDFQIPGKIPTHEQPSSTPGKPNAFDETAHVSPPEFEKQRPVPLGRPPSPAVSGDGLINQPTSRPNVIRVHTAEFPKPDFQTRVPIPDKIPTHEQPSRTPGKPNAFDETAHVFPPVGRPPFEHIGTSPEFPSTASGPRPGKFGEFPNRQTHLESPERPGRPQDSTHNQVAFEKQSPVPLGRPPSATVSGDELTAQPTSTPEVHSVPPAELKKPGLQSSLPTPNEIPTHEQPSSTPGRPNLFDETTHGPQPVGIPPGLTPTTHPSKFGELPTRQTYLERPGRPQGSTHNQVVFEKQSPAPLGRPPSATVFGGELTNQPTNRPEVHSVPPAELKKPGLQSSLTTPNEIPTHEQQSSTPSRPNFFDETTHGPHPVGIPPGLTPTTHPSKFGELPTRQTYLERPGRPPGSTQNQVEFEKQRPALSGRPPVSTQEQPSRRPGPAGFDEITHDTILVPLGPQTSQPISDTILTGKPSLTLQKIPDRTGPVRGNLPQGPLEELLPEVTPAPLVPDVFRVATSGDQLEIEIAKQDYQPTKIPTNKNDIVPPGRLNKPYVSTGTKPGEQKPYISIPTGPQLSETTFRKEPLKGPGTGATRGDRTWKQMPTGFIPIPTTEIHTSQTYLEPTTIPNTLIRKEGSHPSETRFGGVSTSRPASKFPSQSPYDIGTTPESPSKSPLLFDLHTKGPIEGTTPVLLRPYDSTGIDTSQTPRFEIHPGRTPTTYLPPPTTPLTHTAAETAIYLQTPNGPGPYCMCECPRV